jgi:outer membrane protein assembly factor BamE
MPAFHFRLCLILLAALASWGLTGCGTASDTRSKVVNAVKPYKVDIIQGNVVTREQLATLQPGMQRAQVRDVLGTSLLKSMFHENRWDYVFTLKRQDGEPQSRKVTIFFKDEIVEKIEADDLPSEAEFVSTLKSNAKVDKLPALEASAEGLKKFPAPAQAPATDNPVPAAPASYPPLEPASK